jgi:hypothetical protein
MAAKQNSAKAATRGFLELIGPRYDSINLGLAPKDLTKKALQQRLLDDFDHKCVYCSRPLDLKSIQIDHVVPINKTAMGLHMLGNLAAACSSCNGKKLGKALDDYLAKHSTADRERIQTLLRGRRAKFGADVDVARLKILAEDLYQDVSKYVEFRLTQALAAIPEIAPLPKSTLNLVQKKSEFDFSEIAKTHPIGAVIKTKLDGQKGPIVDYSLEGEKGKRKAYVVFLSDQKNKKVTRSVNQVTILER